MEASNSDNILDLPTLISLEYNHLQKVTGLTEYYFSK